MIIVFRQLRSTVNNHGDETHHAFHPRSSLHLRVAVWRWTDSSSLQLRPILYSPNRGMVAKSPLYLDQPNHGRNKLTVSML